MIPVGIAPRIDSLNEAYQRDVALRARRVVTRKLLTRMGNYRQASFLRQQSNSQHASILPEENSWFVHAEPVKC
jgi:hypothetical protein